MGLIKRGLRKGRVAVAGQTVVSKGEVRVGADFLETFVFEPKV